MPKNFSEDSRVKLPALMHLHSLGYRYISSKELHADNIYDEDTNIVTDIFFKKISMLNPHLSNLEIQQLFAKLKISLENDDLGREFYDVLTSTSGIRLIDFDNPLNNDFACVSEFTCKNGEDEFRPDITLLVNGMPLAFIEVKKPNNKEGVLAERDRINRRFKNKKFRKFMNISQVLIFSNNMEYDTESIVPIQGAFYTTTAKEKASFNCFREKKDDKQPDFYSTFSYIEVSPEIENFILKDNNAEVIRHTPEFKTNRCATTPTNRVITSLFSKDRFLFILKYAIAYVEPKKKINGVEIKKLEKHIMRYQQMFATFAIKEKLKKGIKSGIIWHTQGSGKTALAYYNTKYLKNYYASLSVVPKFYFIVDRLDLLTQAQLEFEARGLTVNVVNSREELQQQFDSETSIFNKKGDDEITVVNIQKFQNDTHKVKMTEYAVNIQRIYFIDEAHRGYKPDGCFLSNLFASDKEAIKIALTGTPLIGEEKNSCKVFGEYIDTYYYNQSISDGYTLKLMREDIESNYKMELERVLDEVKLKKSDIPSRKIMADPRYAEAMVDYIINDLINSRISYGDQSIAGMVVCDTSAQARAMFEIFNDTKEKHKLRASLILHDEDDKQIRKGYIAEYKESEDIDILFVFNMLLTGFDAPRLKKLYLGRVLKDHSLLQALTRVNRPYKGFKYGYVVDFANISDEFDKTNEAYLKELKREIGEENMDAYSNLFESNEAVIEQLKEIKEILFGYDCTNAEEFSNQMNEIDDRESLLQIKKALAQAKSLTNVVRTFGDDELKETFKNIGIEKVNALFSAVSNRLDTVNLKSNFEHQDEISGLINQAMATITFSFKKLSEQELRMIGDDYQEEWQRVTNEFNRNFDQEDEEFITLAQAFKDFFKQRGVEPNSAAEAREGVGYMKEVMTKIKEINRRNENIKKMYRNDEKFVRAHKRVVERGLISKRESEVCEVLKSIKDIIDDKVLLNSGILRNDPYFEQTVTSLISQGLNRLKIKAEIEDKRYITTQVAGQYLNQYHNQIGL